MMAETKPGDDALPKRSARSWWGTFACRRQLWWPTRLGWLAIFCLLGGTTSLLWFSSYPFLSVTSRVDAQDLVVEGWIHEYAAQVALQEIQTRPLTRVFVTGGPVTGSGGYAGDQNTSASVGADLLRRVGVDPAIIEMVPSRDIGRDRTYHAALALKARLANSGRSLRSVNVLTEHVHARRSRLLFQKALGPDVQVGVIAVPNPDFEPSRWWRYSEGVKSMVSEGIAYLYACVCF